MTYNASDTKYLDTIPGVVLAVPVIQQTGDVVYQDQLIPVTAIGVDFPNYSALYPTTFAALNGGAISVDPSSNSWVIGYSLYNDTRDNIVPLFDVGDSLNFTWTSGITYAERMPPQSQESWVKWAEVSRPLDWVARVGVPLIGQFICRLKRPEHIRSYQYRDCATNHFGTDK